MQISVIIPTYNPDATRLERVLSSLEKQSLPAPQWELLIVDNGSDSSQGFLKADLNRHPNVRILSEPRRGLTYARICGIKQSRGQLIVFCDDDNLLDPSYLEHAVRIFNCHANLGAAGGKVLPDFETVPPVWLENLYDKLALRDLGEREILASFSDSSKTRAYPRCAPVGAGMVLRRQSARYYCEQVARASQPPLADRSAGSLSSGGDNDIVLTILAKDWSVGYFPQLSLTHIIPAERLTCRYIAKLNHGISRSWVEVLDRHHIRPWPKIPRWSVWPRKINSFFRNHAWQGAAAYISWSGNCGAYEARARLR